MEQIRARIREKRGVDYTEQQIRELAAVKLEKFLDPRGVRSDLLDQFRKAPPRTSRRTLPNFRVRGRRRSSTRIAARPLIRRLLKPMLKLFFNPNPLIQALHIQVAAQHVKRARSGASVARGRSDQLYYELIHNLVVELDAHGDRGQEHEDARRVAGQPARVQRAARARARERRRLQGRERHRPTAGACSRGRRSSRTAIAKARSVRAPPHRRIGTAASSRAGAPAAPSRQPRGTATPQPAPGPAPRPGEGPGQRSRRRRRRRGRAAGRRRSRHGRRAKPRQATAGGRPERARRSMSSESARPRPIADRMLRDARRGALENAFGSSRIRREPQVDDGARPRERRRSHASRQTRPTPTRQ